MSLGPWQHIVTPCHVSVWGRQAPSTLDRNKKHVQLHRIEVDSRNIIQNILNWLINEAFLYELDD